MGRHTDRTLAPPGHSRRNLFLDDCKPLRPEHTRLCQSRVAPLGCDVGTAAHPVVHRYWRRRHPGRAIVPKPDRVRTDPSGSRGGIHRTIFAWRTDAAIVWNIPGIGITRSLLLLHLCPAERHPSMEIAT